MTQLLKPLFRNPSLLLIHSAVTAPPGLGPPAPHPFAPDASADRSHDPNPPPSSPLLRGGFDPLPCSSSPTAASRHPAAARQSATAPPGSYCSAPPSLNSSPHEHTAAAQPCSSASSPSLSSSAPPVLMDPSEPAGAAQTRYRSESRLRVQPEWLFTSPSHRHLLARPPPQAAGAAARPQEPLLGLQEVEWGQHSTQLSFIDEGQQSV